MEIRVSGHQMDTGDALRTYVEERMGAIADKYFSRALSAGVTFGKGPHDSISCDIVAHVMQGLVLKAQGSAQDAHRAFDEAAEKIDKQLRRYMRRLKDKHQGGVEPMHSDLANGTPTHGWTKARENAHYAVFDAGNPEEEAGDAPLIIAETRVDVPAASVSDAVMMLDLRNTNALLFVNTATGSHNMVYRRNDGTIGWVEPQD